MSVQVEKLEHNMAKLTIEVEASKFDAAMKNAYNKKKGSFNLPGFRKGKVPMYIIEKEYGAGVFYEDAANELMPEAYAEACGACAQHGHGAVAYPDRGYRQGHCADGG